jgi:hypothetical protein
MKLVTVKWLHSPRRKYGIPRAAGTTCRLPASLAKQIDKEDPGFLVIVAEEEKERPARIKDTMERKPRTRPVKREKDS